MFVGKLANPINSFVDTIGLAALGWKCYTVYVVWLCVEVAGVYFFVVETKGPSLEAIEDRFDNHIEGFVREHSWVALHSPTNSVKKPSGDVNK